MLAPLELPELGAVERMGRFFFFGAGERRIRADMKVRGLLCSTLMEA